MFFFQFTPNPQVFFSVRGCTVLFCVIPSATQISDTWNKKGHFMSFLGWFKRRWHVRQLFQGFPFMLSYGLVLSSRLAILLSKTRIKHLAQREQKQQKTTQKQRSNKREKRAKWASWESIINSFSKILFIRFIYFGHYMAISLSSRKEQFDTVGVSGQT